MSDWDLDIDFDEPAAPTAQTIPVVATPAVPDSSLAMLVAAIDAVPDLRHDDVILLMNRVETVLRDVKALKVAMDERVIDWIKANGDLTAGPVRWYVGVEKKVKCPDVLKALEWLLNVSGGDFGRVAGCLSANWFKVGTIRALAEEMGAAEDLAAHFKTEAADELREGKAKLLKADEQFSGRGR